MSFDSKFLKKNMLINTNFIFSLKKILNILLIFLIFIFFSQCGIYRPVDQRKIPGNAKDRAQKNIEEGKSITFSTLAKGGSGEFEFASSNEMWRATIEMLNFIPLSSADYGGGTIITDWYNDGSSENQSIKIMVRFLSNEIRADGIEVVVYKKDCLKDNNSSCKTSTNNELSDEIKLAILKKASSIKNETVKNNAEKYKKEKPFRSPAYKNN